MRLLSRCGLVAVLWTANCTAAQQTQQADLNVQHREPIRMERKPVQRPPVVIGQRRSFAFAGNDSRRSTTASHIINSAMGFASESKDIAGWHLPERSATLCYLCIGHTFLQRMTLHDQLKLAIPEAGSQ